MLLWMGRWSMFPVATAGGYILTMLTAFDLLLVLFLQFSIVLVGYGLLYDSLIWL